MIYVRLKGGMGNQMFQYAFGYSIAAKLETGFSLDLSNLLDRNKGADFVYRDYDLPIFQVEENFLTSPDILRLVFRLKHNRVSKAVGKLALRGKRYTKEAHFHFQPSLLHHAADNTLYEGWFQSPKYFAEVETDIRRHFQFRNPVLDYSKALHQRIQQSNAICLNVRRTDFLKVDTLNATNLDYFLRAAEYMGEKVANPHFFIFSDDIEWCRTHIRLPHPTEVVDHSHKGHKFGNYLQLMRDCKHFIIPNSSFAWWAAWLNDQPGKIVIAPENWFTDPSINTADLIPPSWVRL